MHYLDPLENQPSGPGVKALVPVPHTHLLAALRGNPRSLGCQRWESREGLRDPKQDVPEEFLRVMAPLSFSEARSAADRAPSDCSISLCLSWLEALFLGFFSFPFPPPHPTRFLNILRGEILWNLSHLNQISPGLLRSQDEIFVHLTGLIRTRLPSPLRLNWFPDD